MKIIAFDRPFDASPGSQAWDDTLSEVRLPDSIGVEIIADSARVRPGTPVFLPDFARRWQFEVVPALYINRVGKHIARRFAHRYIGGVGMAVRLLPPQGEDSLRCSALSGSFDGALTELMTGEPHLDSPLTLSVRLIAPDGSASEPPGVTITPGQLMAEATVSLVSRFMTLKTGDIILPCSTGLRVAAAIDSVVECRLESGGVLSPVLKVKVK